MGTMEHDSIVAGRDKLSVILNESLGKINAIWNRIGFSSDVRKHKMETIIEHIQDVLGQTISGEEIIETALREDVEKFSNELQEICSELETAAPAVDQELPLICLGKSLRAYLLSFQHEKQSRLDQWRELCEKYHNICSRLGLQPTYSLVMTPQAEEPNATIPSQEAIISLQSDIDVKERLIAERATYLDAMSKTLQKQYKRMNVEPSSDLERKLLADSEEIPLSDETMEQLSILEKNLEAKLAQYLIRVQSEIERCREDILQLWNDCFVSQKERDSFPFLDNLNFSEELLERHRLEVDRLKAAYESKRDIFLLLREWKSLFLKMVIFDERANDPTRFSNRGGALLREQKERKAVMKHLPEVEAELSKLVFQWEESHGEKVYIEGRPFLEYLTTEKLEHEQRKEEARAKRVHRKQAQKQEQIFGTVPGSTLSLRRS